MQLVHYLLVFFGGMITGGGLMFWKYNDALTQVAMLESIATNLESRIKALESKL